MSQHDAEDEGDGASATSPISTQGIGPDAAGSLRAKPPGSTSSVEGDSPPELSRANSASGTMDGESDRTVKLEVGPQTVEQTFPRATAELKGAGLARDARRRTLLEATEAGLSEDEIVALAQPLPLQITSPTRAYLRTRWLTFKYEVISWWRHRNPLERLFYAVGWSAALVGPTIHLGFTWVGAAGAAVVLVLRLRAAAGELTPKHMPILKLNHGARQLALEKLVHKLLLWVQDRPTGREISDFQQEALVLIASYVRDHRSDLKGRKIFANLLVKVSSSEVAVIARSDNQRPIPSKYRAEECSVCWAVFQEQGVKFTGDVYADHPNTPAGKRYRSILALPVKLGGTTVAVVSLDSEAAYHFDRCFALLATELAPFVQLLAGGLDAANWRKT